MDQEIQDAFAIAAAKTDDCIRKLLLSQFQKRTNMASRPDCCSGCCESLRKPSPDDVAACKSFVALEPKRAYKPRATLARDLSRLDLATDELYSFALECLSPATLDDYLSFNTLERVHIQTLLTRANYIDDNTLEDELRAAAVPEAALKVLLRHRGPFLAKIEQRLPQDSSSSDAADDDSVEEGEPEEETLWSMMAALGKSMFVRQASSADDDDDE